MADEQTEQVDMGQDQQDCRFIEFTLWDGTTLFFTEKSGPYTVEIHDGIIVIIQGEEETGIPTSSLKYSIEHEPHA